MNEIDLRWFSLEFSGLSGTQMHEILRVRQDVFVIEQECIYPDIDQLDKQSVHVFAENKQGEVFAYARLVAPGAKYPEPAVGRVVVSGAARGLQLGRMLMQKTLAESDQRYPGQGNRISAQAHLENFYRSLGYERVSDEYDEDGIPHIEMLRP